MNPCVSAILCSLSSATLGVLQGIINAQIGLLQAKVLELESQLLQYDVIALPVQAAGQLASAEIQKIRNSALLIPFNLIAGCTDLDKFNASLQASLDFATATLDQFTGDLTRILSYKTELASVVEELNGIIAQFNDVLDIIGACTPITR